MENRQRLLEVKGLKTSFFTDAGEVKAVNDVSYHINEQEVVAIVGESGCGKSVTQMLRGRISGATKLWRQGPMNCWNWLN